MDNILRDLEEQIEFLKDVLSCTHLPMLDQLLFLPLNGIGECTGLLASSPGHSQLLMLHVEKRATLKAESGLGTRLPICFVATDPPRPVNCWNRRFHCCQSCRLWKVNDSAPIPCHCHHVVLTNWLLLSYKTNTRTVCNNISYYKNVTKINIEQ